MFKKLICTVLLFFGLLTPLFLVSASSSTEEEWQYWFHLQVVNNVLGINTDEEYAYRTIPEAYSETTDPDASDYYGTIISGKGKLLAKFGFNKPQTILVSQGKSIFDAKAPYFANADHVTIYTREGKRLFDISVSRTSFCDDDNRCDGATGENFVNCPNDCPPPEPEPVNTVPTATTTGVEPISSTTPSTPPVVNDPGAIVTTSTTPVERTPITLTTIVFAVAGILCFVFVFVLWRMRSHMD